MINKQNENNLISINRLKKKFTEEKGLLLPSNWDHNGNITELSFFMENESDLQIDPLCDLYDDLKKQVKNNICIDGFLKKRNNQIFLYVSNFVLA